MEGVADGVVEGGPEGGSDCVTGNTIGEVVERGSDTAVDAADAADVADAAALNKSLAPAREQM